VLSWSLPLALDFEHFTKLLQVHPWTLFSCIRVSQMSTVVEAQ